VATALTALVIGATSLACPSDARAEDNTTQVYNDGGAHNVPGTLFVGDTGTNNSLSVSNATDLTSGTGIIGNQATADNNFAVVTGAGSSWVNTGTGPIDGIIVGNFGSSNNLTISAGATSQVQDVYMGRESGSTNNSMLITGSGSFLNITRFFDVGRFGANNTLTISAGGRIDTNHEIRIGGLAGASNNVATVTGSGSQWNSPGINMRVGGDPTATNNHLVVTDNATLSTFHIDLGYLGSNGNAISVSSGGTLTVSNDIFVGGTGDNNTLTISAGGTVNPVHLYVGFDAGSDNNNLVVSGASAQLIMGGFMDIGNKGAGNTMTISNGGKVQNGAEARIGARVGSANNTVVVTGAGSQWNSTGGMVVGADDATATGNRLHINDSASVTSTYLILGRTTGSGGTVSLAGGTYTGSANVTIGAVAGVQAEVNGWGTVSSPASQLQNNGHVIADGQGVDRTLNMSSFSSVANPMDNTSNHGWFARNHGKLTLPSLAVASGASSINWGESAADTSIDLVNSARLDLTGAAGGTQSISLLARDRADVPAFVHPMNHRLSSIWDFGGTLDDVVGTGSVDLTFRYDEGVYEHMLQLYRYDGSAWVLESAALIDALNDRISLAGVTASSAGLLYATAVPEPSLMMPLCAAGALVVVRRPGKLRHSRPHRRCT
jgi:T5SS/PEP-CTERM-associated repeat protein